MNKNYKIGIVILSLIIMAAIIFYCFKNEKVYTLKDYYPETKQTAEYDYVIRNEDTVFHGKFTRYNEKGNIVAQGNFVDNEPFGNSIYYFDNGNIESIHYRKNRKITLESIVNYSNGKIKKYVLYDDLGKANFIIRYDEKGTVLSYDGYPQVETYQYKYAHKEQFNIKENQNLKVGDTLKYSYIVANIPNTKRSFKIENNDVDNAKVKRILKNVPPAQIDVKEVLTKKGKNTIRSIIRYEFKDKVTPVFLDTISFDVDVN